MEFISKHMAPITFCTTPGKAVLDKSLQHWERKVPSFILLKKMVLILTVSVPAPRC